MRKLKVVIADDSVIYRSQIRAALDLISGVEVVASASNGRLAADRVSQGAVDLLILDLEMPEMDGLQTLVELKKRGATCKVLVFSSASKRGAEITMDALRLGASDFIAKPGAEQSAGEGGPAGRIRELLEPRIRALFSMQEVALSLEPAPKSDSPRYPKVHWDIFRPRIILIGSSTGGPTALERIFSQLVGPIQCPILITQHMPPVFTAALAERLAGVSGIPAQEAKHGAFLENNKIYMAPGDFHLRVQGTLESPFLTLDQNAQINSVRPAVDPMFSSASAIFKSRCLGIVLTGMGADGRAGAEAIKAQGGAVVIQSKESCVVDGMPGAVRASGAFDRESTPDEIAKLLVEKTGARAAREQKEAG
jgi:two-component system chemotaxis response regulator CheB